MDPIERQAAIEINRSYHGQMPNEVNHRIWKEINALPSAQPEIIRCKDCRWRKDQSGSVAWLPCRAIVTPSDFYCGRAERRGDVMND